MSESLKDFLKETLSPVITNKQHLDLVLKDTWIKKYWINAFTHRSVDAVNNYETLEYYGDKVLHLVFSQYLRKYYENENITEHHLTVLSSHYMSKRYQSQLSKKLGLISQIRISEHVKEFKASFHEDLFESFFGALYNVCVDEKKLGMGLATIYCFNFIVFCFEDQPLQEISSIQENPKTQLKNLFEKYMKKEPSYETEQLTGSKWTFQTKVRNPISQELLGEGHGYTIAEAETNAATKALSSLEEQGFTFKHVEKLKAQSESKQDPELKKLYDQVNEKIESVNKKNRVQIESALLHKVSGDIVSNVYTYVMKVRHIRPNGSIQEMLLPGTTVTGKNEREVKKNVLINFLDSFK